MKITELTEAQTEAMYRHRDEWLAIGLASGATNRDIVEPIITDFYQESGKSKPTFIYVKSPMGAQLLLNLLHSPDVGDSVRDSVWASVRDSVWASVWDSVRDSVWDSVWNSVRDSVWASVWDSVGDSVRDSVWASVWDSVRAMQQIQKQLRFFESALYGAHEGYWVAHYLFYALYVKTDIYKESDLNVLNQWASLSKNSGWWYPFENVCVICDRPEYTKTDEQGRLHGGDTSAIRFADGWSVYAWHGTRIPESIWQQRESMTATEILNIENTEIRRSIMEMLGTEKFCQKLIADNQGRSIHEDVDLSGNIRKLWQFNLGNESAQDLQAVQVICPSTARVYFLGVPRTVKGKRVGYAQTCHEAVARTFNLYPQEYRLVAES